MSHHLSRRDADRILDAPGESDHPVGRSIQALRAPGSTSELHREDATVAAFHAARLSPTSRPMSGVAPSARSAAVRAVAATGIVVALSSGGFALAASGNLPTLPDQASNTATEAVAARTAQQTTSPGGTTTEVPTEAPTEVGTTTVASGTTSETATSETAVEATAAASDAAATAPVPSFTGLCTAYQAADKSAHGKALDSAAFTALITAAGGKDAIATYCVGLIGEPKATGKPTTKPTQAATAKPTQAATGKPATKPTQAATGKPTTQTTTTGQPTAVPAPTDQGKPAEAGEPAGTGKPGKTGKP
ncbi:hypothetical protein ASG88_17220 [Nocardioides sp. Soil777]|uniref:hypothetical protein n=1 Tax=Nocardioides sp. Soil777 TaxID=1736409 RepID=UPI0007036FD6|nr:hypothetical protein [Nocardioides sp. Soil777]KRE98780.1 hypothetical protein ASG88_17220 [Nocardioides sp. Soil777]